MDLKDVHVSNAKGIWLDDVRPNPDPTLYNYTARNFSEFRAVLDKMVTAGETLDNLDLDYMLSDFPDPNWSGSYEKNGADCAELLVMYVWDNPNFLDEHFCYAAHSSDDSCNQRIYKKMQLLKEK